MEVKIKYEDILKRCEMLSSFESEGKFDANGESRYLEIHINKVDEQLIQQYIMQARGILEERMERMIENIEDGCSVEYPTFTNLLIGVADENITDSSGNLDISTLQIAFFQQQKKFAYYHMLNAIQYEIDDNVPSEYSSNTMFYCIQTKKMYKKENGILVVADIEHSSNVVFYDDAFTWTIRDNTRWNGIKTFTKHVHEAIVSYAMAAWLRGKLDDRVAFYEGLFNSTLAQAVKNLFTKQPPKK